ncbi:hypothetical protein FRC19_002984 [Serendipita sp. 401]|nr:hypothetical protein FRC19_002984 [Serendipita sp. 401]
MAIILYVEGRRPLFHLGAVQCIPTDGLTPSLLARMTYRYPSVTVYLHFDQQEKVRFCLQGELENKTEEIVFSGIHLNGWCRSKVQIAIQTQLGAPTQTIADASLTVLRYSTGPS